MLKGYEANDEEIKKFADNIIIWRNEILNSNILKKSFDYFDNNLKMSDGNIYYRNHSINIKIFIKKLLSKEYKNFENIELYEEVFYDKCNNGGLTFHEYGIYDHVTTYDKKMFYPSIMGSKYFEFPTSKGEICNIWKIPKNKFIYGIYNVRIESNDENFNKIFAFSKENYYTHFSLNFVCYYNKKLGGNIKLNLLSNSCLKYKHEQFMIQSSKVFQFWYKTLKKYREEFPKNKILKKLASTAWGELQSKNVIIKTQEEIENENINYGRELDVDKNKYYLKKYEIKNDIEIYKLIDLTKPIYKFQFRLKSFLTSYARTQMALIALKNINNVIRIQTDSITYNIPIEINEFQFIKENVKSDCKAEVKSNSLIIL